MVRKDGKPPLQEESTMTSANTEPTWFNPPKFWAATKNMSPQQVDSLMDTLFFLAEIRNLDALRKFHFIGIGHSYLWSQGAKRAKENA
jgi:hypothetical protein